MERSVTLVAELGVGYSSSYEGSTRLGRGARRLEVLPRATTIATVANIASLAVCRLGWQHVDVGSCTDDVRGGDVRHDRVNLPRLEGWKDAEISCTG